MPYTRKTPWVHIFGRGTTKGETAKDDFAYALKSLGITDMHVSFTIWDAVLLAATHPWNPATIPELLRVFDNEAGAWMQVRDLSVLGRVAHFKAKVVTPPMSTTGVFGFDGVDFYVAPNERALKSMIESLTVRDGNEREPAQREITRYYELGSYVIALHMTRKTGWAALGRLWPDGTFTPVTTPNKNEAKILLAGGLDMTEDICVDMKIGLGEQCFRLAAQNEAVRLFSAFPALHALHGVAVVFDKNGVVLGRRIEHKHGSILPALGGLRTKRRKKRRSR